MPCGLTDSLELLKDLLALVVSFSLQQSQQDRADYLIADPDNTSHVILQELIPQFHNSLKQITSSAGPDTPHGIGICQRGPKHRHNSLPQGNFHPPLRPTSITTFQGLSPIPKKTAGHSQPPGSPQIVGLLSSGGHRIVRLGGR